MRKVKLLSIQVKFIHLNLLSYHPSFRAGSASKTNEFFTDLDFIFKNFALLVTTFTIF